MTGCRCRGHFTERLVLLPHTLLHTDHAAMYPRPPAGPPPAAPAPIGGAAGGPAAGPVVACFNRLLKIDAPTFRDWLSVLRTLRPERGGVAAGRGGGCWGTLWLLEHGARAAEARAALTRYAREHGVRTVGPDPGPDGEGSGGAGGPCLVFTPLAAEEEHIAEKVRPSRPSRPPLTPLPPSPPLPSARARECTGTPA